MIDINEMANQIKEKGGNFPPKFYKYICHNFHIQ